MFDICGMWVVNIFILGTNAQEQVDGVVCGVVCRILKDSIDYAPEQVTTP